MDRLVREANMWRGRTSADDAEVAGERKFDLAAVIGPAVLFVITAVYLAYELHWQLDLLHTMGSAHASRDDVDWLVLEGRALAAFGLTWAFLKTMLLRSAKDSMSSMVVTFVLVGGATLLMFTAIGRLYDAVIDELPADTSLHLYKVAAHRQWSLAGDLPRDASAADPVAVMLWPLKMADSAQSAGIEQVFDKRADGFREGASEQARKLWPQAKEKLAAFGAAGSGELRSKFEDYYAKYVDGSQQTRSIISSWQERRSNYFQDLTGITPNPGATREQFATALLSAKINQLRQLGQLYLDTKGFTLDPVVFQSGDVAYNASDFEGVRNESDFVRVVIKKAAGGMAAMVPTLGTVKSRPEASNIVASAVVPPISMTLSTVSILVNAGALLGLLCVRLPVLRHLQAVIPLVFAAGVLVALRPTQSLPGLDAGMAWLHANLTPVAWLIERVVTFEHLLLNITR
ncbi:hypothetical protein [Roseateles sp. MS654]|uniref:hypothetical protein n=1 Tax=Roseateles sp. MS654 TaxID=3412685 RepID=UPI003C30AF99